MSEYVVINPKHLSIYGVYKTEKEARYIAQKRCEDTAEEHYIAKVTTKCIPVNKKIEVSWVGVD